MFKEVMRRSAPLVFSITEAEVNKLRGDHVRERTQQGICRSSSLWGTMRGERVEVNKDDALLSGRTPERWWAHEILKDSWNKLLYEIPKQRILLFLYVPVSYLLCDLLQPAMWPGSSMTHSYAYPTCIRLQLGA